jgi:hypothetical protein
MSTFFENDRPLAVAHRIFLRHRKAVNDRLSAWLGEPVNLGRLRDVDALRSRLLRDAEDAHALAGSSPRYFWLTARAPLSVGVLEPVDGLFTAHDGGALLDHVKEWETVGMPPTTAQSLRDIAEGTQWDGERAVDYDGLELTIYGQHGPVEVQVYRDGAGNLVAEWGPGKGASEGLELFEDFPKGFLDQNPGEWRLGTYASIAPLDGLDPNESLLRDGALPVSLRPGCAFVHGKVTSDPQDVLEAHRAFRWVVWAGRVWAPGDTGLVDSLLRYFGDPRADAPMGVDVDGRRRYLLRDVTVGDDVVARFAASTLPDRVPAIPGWAAFAPMGGRFRTNVAFRDLDWGYLPAREPVVSVALSGFASGDWVIVTDGDLHNTFWRIGSDRWAVVEGSAAWE